jgi:hypothetical protein
MNPLTRIAAEISAALWGRDDAKLAELCRQYADAYESSKRPTLLELDVVEVGWDACGREVEESL